MRLVVPKPASLLDGTRHVLTNVDPSSKEATCSTCGVNTRISKASKNTWRCWRVTAAAAARYRDRLRMQDGPQAMKWRHIKMRYGISKEEFFNKLSAQGNRCAVCSRKFTEDLGPHIDHNHETGQNRDLLCGSCNRALGLFGDSADRVISAMLYLLRWETQNRGNS